MKLFLDTNVIVDVLADRAPFAAESSRVWGQAETRRVQGLVSAVSFTTVYHVTRRTRFKHHAETAVRLLRDVFTPVACDAVVLDRAIDADFDDFEDAVQYFCAVMAGAEVLITRNSDHFPSTALPVMTPAAYLAAHS